MEILFKELFFSLVVLAIAVVRIESSNDCATPDCISLVDSIKASRNGEVNPCDDFYEYACGKWGESNPIPHEERIWGVSHIMSKHTKETLIGMLNDDVEVSNTTEAFRKAKKMFQNCMNLEAIENNGVRAIVAYFEKTGGWPAVMALNDWTPSRQSIREMRIDHIKNLNLQLFYEFNVYSHNESCTEKSLHIDLLSVLPFPHFFKSHSRNSSRVAQWVGNITEIVKTFASAAGTNAKIEDMENDINNMVDFEYSILEIWKREVEATETANEKHITVNNFQEWYNDHSHSDNSKIIWADFFEALFNNTGLHFSGTDSIVVSSPNYIKSITKLLDSTATRTIVNYIQYGALKKLMHGAPKQLRDIAFEMERIMKYTEVEPKREEICLHSIGFEHATSYEYVKRYVHPETKQLVNEIITNLSDAAYQVLNQTSWLRSDLVDLISRKLSTMRRFIGYPDWYDTPSAVDDYYEQCVISDNFVENIIEVGRFMRNLSISQLAQPVDKRQIPFAPTSLKQNYSPNRNSLVLSAASLQAPLFSKNYPRVFKYAVLGAIIGHEISHAFDGLGGAYDENGNVIDWLSNDMKSEFNSRVHCFVEQYNKYKTYEIRNRAIYVNGRKTKNENIGDSSGLKLAYRAYQNAKTSEDVNLRLPGLESYTDEQLFFLGFANHWCSHVQPSYYRKTALRRSKSVPKFRVIGTLSNMKEFSTAFNCSVTSTMNPSNKCGIWGPNN